MDKKIRSVGEVPLFLLKYKIKYAKLLILKVFSYSDIFFKKS